MDEIGPPSDSAGNGTAERAILTVGGLVRTTKAVVEENVLEGTTPLKCFAPAWLADGLTLFRRLKGRKFGTPLAGSVNACGSETLFRKE